MHYIKRGMKPSNYSIWPPGKSTLFIFLQISSLFYQKYHSYSLHLSNQHLEITDCNFNCDRTVPCLLTFTVGWRWGELTCYLPHYSDKFVKRLVHIHSNLGTGFYVFDIELPWHFQPLISGYLPNKRKEFKICRGIYTWLVYNICRFFKYGNLAKN